MPLLVVISGLPGTGKTAVAAGLAAAMGAVHVSIDVIEEELLAAGLPHSWETGVAAYGAARAVAELNLALGRTVVVDAVNDSEAARDTWRVGSRNVGSRLQFVLLTLDDPIEHRRRLEHRQRSLRHVTEPTWDDVQRRAAAFEPWDAECLEASAAGPLDEVVAHVMNKLPAD